MNQTVQHEKGKADVIADGPGTVRQVPEGTGEREAGVPETARQDDEPEGWINGQPATKQEVERSTQTS
jgi:hypothetical protein